METITAPLPGSALAEWESYILARHPQEMELGLERVAAVARRMGLPAAGQRTVVIGGTNGKGSTTLVLEAMLERTGHSTGATLSPHLHRYNERFRVGGREADDGAIVAALGAVHAAAARAPAVSLTYFEYTLLGAMELAAAAQVDYLLVEVGLGGRLDAANIIDADVAVITSVALDHQDWLGDTRELIAAEKAAIGRPGRSLVYGEADVPARVRSREDEGVEVRAAGEAYVWEVEAGCFRWWRRAGVGQPVQVPVNHLQGLHPANLAAGLEALAVLEVFPTSGAVDLALADLRIPARFEKLRGALPLVVDVAHNPHAAAALAARLREHFAGRRITLVLGCLRDKDVEGIAAALGPVARRIVACTVEGPRGLSAEELCGRLAGGPSALPIRSADGVGVALDQLAAAPAASDDVYVVAGSFAAAGAARDWHFGRCRGNAGG